MNDTTFCQLPILDLEANFTASVTEQLPEWGDEMYVATKEMVLTNLTISQGHPVQYHVDWYGPEFSTDYDANYTHQNTGS